MEFSVKELSTAADFPIVGASYIGNPVTRTAMFITKKVEHLLVHLENVEECLVFAEKGMKVPKELMNNHCFVFSDNPQLSYAEFAYKFEQATIEEEKSIGYIHKEGSFISKNAILDNSVYIEPGCLIGHNVQIGENSRILSGSVIKNSVIGDGFLCNEYAVIGANGFTMAENHDGNKVRIPSLGKVIIGNHVEVGAHDNISRGSGGNTTIEDYVKLDAFVHIGHDVHIKKNVEITAGSVVGGFDVLNDSVYIGLNSTLRNRIIVGEGSIIGMGSVVIKNVDTNATVVGNPIKTIERK